MTQAQIIAEIEEQLNSYQRPAGWDRKVQSLIQKFFADNTEQFAELMLPFMKSIARSSQEN